MPTIIKPAMDQNIISFPLLRSCSLLMPPTTSMTPPYTMPSKASSPIMPKRNLSMFSIKVEKVKYAGRGFWKVAAIATDGRNASVTQDNNILF